MAKTRPASPGPKREVGESCLKAGGVRPTCHPLSTAHRPCAAAPDASQAPARPCLPPPRASAQSAPLHHHPAAVPGPALGPEVHHGRYYFPSDGMMPLFIDWHCFGAGLGAAHTCPERRWSPGARLGEGCRCCPGGQHTWLLRPLRAGGVPAGPQHALAASLHLLGWGRHRFAGVVQASAPGPKPGEVTCHLPGIYRGDGGGARGTTLPVAWPPAPSAARC